MNFSSIFGFGIAAAIIWFGVVESAARPEIFLDTHALLLVIGGTSAATFIAFPFSRVLGLFKMVVFGVFLKQANNNRHLVEEMVLAAAAVQQDPTLLASRSASHPFLEEGLQLVSEGALTETELQDVLNRRSTYFRKSYLADAKMFNTLAKFPPAFGLLGATTGMITMMTSLGSGGQDKIGAAMAIALVATFWGIAVANLVLLPLADYAARLASDDAATRQMIADGVMMIKRRESVTVIAEKLNGALALNERLRMRRTREGAADVKNPPDSDNDSDSNSDLQRFVG
jgi:chemotaxis protein MotA